MTTTAATLTAAAARLRQLDTTAHPGPWNPVSLEDDQWAVIFCGPRDAAGYLQGAVLDMREDCEDCTRPSPVDLRLICDLRDAASPLAALFEKLAWMVDLDPGLEGRVGVDEAVAVAHAVLHGTEQWATAMHGPPTDDAGSPLRYVETEEWVPHPQPVAWPQGGTVWRWQRRPADG